MSNVTSVSARSLVPDLSLDFDWRNCLSVSEGKANGRRLPEVSEATQGRKRPREGKCYVAIVTWLGLAILSSKDPSRVYSGLKNRMLLSSEVLECASVVSPETILNKTIKA